MKKGGKVLLTVFSAAALVVASVIGSIAYFTDSESVVNTFTVGQVKMSMDEADVDLYGNQEYVDPNADPKVEKPRVQENDYLLVPGHTYKKDPIVHVDSESENCYVFIAIDNQIEDIEWDYTNELQDNSIAGQMKKNGWNELIDGTAPVVLKDGSAELLVYTYRNIIQKSANPNKDTDLKVFESFRIDGDTVINREDENSTEETDAAGNHYIEAYDGKTVVVKAYAVQADGFETALDAWEATYGKTE